MLLYVFSLLTILVSYLKLKNRQKNENWQPKKKKRQKMVVGKKKIGQKIWPVKKKKKSAKVVGRQKILVT